MFCSVTFPQKKRAFNQSCKGLDSNKCLKLLGLEACSNKHHHYFFLIISEIRNVLYLWQWTHTFQLQQSSHAQHACIKKKYQEGRLFSVAACTHQPVVLLQKCTGDKQSLGLYSLVKLTTSIPLIKLAAMQNLAKLLTRELGRTP